jgi:pimeloyl-ACP methyl ester carboxylesterase
MAAGKGVLEKVRRFVRTIYFMLAMLASLMILSLPLLVAFGDIMVPSVLISSFTCIRCYGFKQHLHRYAFKSSLTDIPLVSIIRSLIITCVYSACDGPALSHGPYLSIVTLCSLSSILVLSIKACVFTVNSQIEAEASSSSVSRRIHLKKSWGMPVLFLSSMVFALGHIVVAYRTSCRARRKLLFHRVDTEAAITCKTIFCGFQKVPRSSITSSKVPKCGGETRRKLPVRLLADTDSLFMACQGLTLHYKLHLSSTPPRSSSSVNFFDRTLPNAVLKNQFHHHRSISLYTPLLDRATSLVMSEEEPIFSVDENGDEDEANKLNSSPKLEWDLEGNGVFGIVLVHGFGGGIFSWRHVMGVLARQVGCTVAAFDRPGWGLTSRPKKQDWEESQLHNPYKLETQVDLLLSFCVEMGFASVVLVGHDDGGLLALKAAQRAQSSSNSVNVEVKGVVLLTASFSREVVPAFARILLRTSLGKKHLVRPLLRAEITQVVNRRAWYDATKLTTEVLSLYKAPLCVEGWDEALQEIGRLSSETILSQQNANSLLKAVKDIPVLVVAGAEDALVPLKSVQSMASKLANSRLVAISGCGHLPHEECPKALLAAISPFISRLLCNSQ